MRPPLARCGFPEKASAVYGAIPTRQYQIGLPETPYFERISGLSGRFEAPRPGRGPGAGRGQKTRSGGPWDAVAGVENGGVDGTRTRDLLRVRQAGRTSWTVRDRSTGFPAPAHGTPRQTKWWVLTRETAQGSLADRDQSGC